MIAEDNSKMGRICCRTDVAAFSLARLVRGMPFARNVLLESQ